MKMPSRPSPGAIDLALDVQALRHLVTRRQIGNALWSGDVRSALEGALRKVHGEKAFCDIERTVSQQLLLTRMNLLPELLDSLYEENSNHRAKQVLGIISEILRTNIEDSESIQFQDEFVLLLLQAVIQASLQILIQADSSAVGATYRTTIDLIREMFESCEETHTALALKKAGVKLVKDVATYLTRSDKKGAILKANKFLKKYSNKHTSHSLKEQAQVLKKELEPLVIRQYYENSTARAHEGVRRSKRGRKKLQVHDDKPDFFSDRSDETSDATLDNETPQEDARDTGHGLLDDVFGSDLNTESFVDTPTIPPKKRSRMSRGIVDGEGNDSERVENGEITIRSDTPVSKTRGKRYPDIGQELNRMNSPMFSETRPVPESVDHVARHAKTRSQTKPWRLTTKRKSLLTHRRSPTSISQEESSPTYRGKRALRADELADREGKGIDKDDADAIGRMGKEGEILQDLHTKATQLQHAGPSDPLPEAIRDARQAKRRKRSLDPSYSPNADAREASPFPESDDESELSRKKVSRLRLAETPEGQRSTRPVRRPPVAKSATYMFGKQCRTGRFEPLEDKLLLKGLQALGWGAWTEIAREFWEGEFTRAPSSLKDRARTLGLGPQSYPRRLELRGRPRLSDIASGDRGPLGKLGNLSEEDKDQDEDEDDPIEAPNRTPASGDEEDAEDAEDAEDEEGKAE